MHNWKNTVCYISEVELIIIKKNIYIYVSSPSIDGRKCMCISVFIIPAESDILSCEISLTSLSWKLGFQILYITSTFDNLPNILPNFYCIMVG